MNEKNTKYLLEKYPDLYSNHKLPISQSCMAFGFEVGDGWFKLIDELSAAIVKISPETKASQVKEKFSGLRFYTDFSSDAVDKLIEKAEAESFKICENCGKPGKCRGKGWLTTLCEKCWEDYLKRK